MDTQQNEFLDITSPLILRFLTNKAKVANENNIYLKEKDIFDELCKCQNSYYYNLLLEKQKNNGELSNDELDEISWYQENNVNPNYPRTKFAEYVYLIVYNLARSYKFAGYSNNWKAEMCANAIELVFKYAIKNFDRDKTSIRNGHQGNRIKAFAYITQIAYNGFIQKIKEMKTYEELKNNHEIYGAQSEAALLELSGDLSQVKIKNRSTIKSKDETLVDDNNHIIACVVGYNENDEFDENLYLKIRRGKDINISEIDNTLKENDLIIFDTNENKILEKSKFESIYDILNNYNIKYPFLTIIYPLNYLLKYEEMDKIHSLNLPALSINKYNNTYIPSFPTRARKKKTKDDEIVEEFYNEWLE